jgi:hypothetical protein
MRIVIFVAMVLFGVLTTSSVNNTAIASLGSPPSGMGVSKPRLMTSTGDLLTEGIAGKMSVISVAVTNGFRNATSFVAIIEVRNENDISEHIQFQLGSIDPGGRVDVGVSWVPESAGKYQLRTVVVSSLESPSVMTPVQSRSITIQERVL